MKLRSMNMKEPSTKQILGDIFGSGNGETQFSGLIDSTDVSDFNRSGIYFALAFF